MTIEVGNELKKHHAGVKATLENIEGHLRSDRLSGGIEVSDGQQTMG
jgi:hypothetical protein